MRLKLIGLLIALNVIMASCTNSKKDLEKVVTVTFSNSLRYGDVLTVESSFYGVCKVELDKRISATTFGGFWSCSFGSNTRDYRVFDVRESNEHKKLLTDL